MYVSLCNYVSLCGLCCFYEAAAEDAADATEQSQASQEGSPAVTPRKTEAAKASAPRTHILSPASVQGPKPGFVRLAFQKHEVIPVSPPSLLRLRSSQSLGSQRTAASVMSEGENSVCARAKSAAWWIGKLSPAQAFAGKPMRNDLRFAQECAEKLKQIDVTEALEHPLHFS